MSKFCLLALVVLCLVRSDMVLAQTAQHAPTTGRRLSKQGERKAKWLPLFLPAPN